VKEWVVVSNKSEAKIFFRENQSDSLRWYYTLTNKKARRHEFYYSRGRPGLSYAKFSGSKSPHPHSLSKEKNHADLSADKFAQTLAKYLIRARVGKKFAKLTLFAAPGFLGKLRRELASQHPDFQIQFINKNIEKMRTDTIDLRAHF
jgi:protein required for attachment to host cells